MVYLQVKLCDPCLSAFRLCMGFSPLRGVGMGLYINIFIHQTCGRQKNMRKKPASTRRRLRFFVVVVVFIVVFGFITLLTVNK